MESTDQELLRFREVYGRKSEEEIRTIAEDAYDLTEIAKEALQAEIAGRRLDIRLKTAPPPPPEVEPGPFADLLAIGLYHDAGNLRRIKEVLDNAGIISFLGPDNLTDIDQFRGSYDTGVELKVPSVIYRNAMSTLAKTDWPDDPETEDAMEEADDKAYSVFCPKCRAGEIIFEDRVPVPGQEDKFNWRCEACGHKWQDDGVE